MILVTGAAGFIGSHVCDGLLAAGLRVRGADNLSFGSLDNLAQARENPAFEFVQADLADAADCARACYGVQAVLHHAARVGVPDSISDPQACERDTAQSTFALLHAAAQGGARRFVLASTAAVYGDAPCPVREDSPCAPLSPYGRFKLAAEVAVANARGIDGVSLRYFNVYGPRQSPASAYAGVITRFAQRLREGKPLTIFGDGRQTRDFIHVSDIVRANIAALRPAPLKGQAINIATSKTVNMLELGSLMAKILGCKPKYEYKPERQGDIHNSWAEVKQAQQVLSFKASVPLAQGLRELLK